MAVRRLKPDLILDHPVRTFLAGLVGVVKGAEAALATFDAMARDSLEREALLLRYRELGGELARVLGKEA